MKTIFQTLALFLTIGLGTAAAQNTQFQGTPTVTDLGTQLQFCGKLVGLGNNQMVTVQVMGQTTITTTCTNQGGKTAPGLTQTRPFSAAGMFSSDKNGTVTFCLTTTAPAPGQCPNGNFTATVTDATFTNITVKVNGVPVPF